MNEENKQNHCDTPIEQAIDVIDRDDFLKKCIGISLILTSVIVSSTIGLVAGGAAKSYILSKIEKCN